MKITHYEKLSGAPRALIRQIVEECQSLGLKLNFPFDDASSTYLICDPDPAGVLALVLPEAGREEDGAECSAFIRPDFRRRGYFSALLKEASREVSELDLYFLADPADEGAMMTLEAIGADLLDSEYRMELSLENLEKIIRPSSRSVVRENAISSIHSPDPETDREICFSFFRKNQAPAIKTASVIPAGGNEESFCIGGARVALYGDSACLHDFEILPAFRGMGYGRESLFLLLQSLERQKLNTLFLHVSESNRAAVSLYKEAGFRITETLSCYLY